MNSEEGFPLRRCATRAGWVALLLSGGAAAQAPPRAYLAHRATAPPAIDGVLDEPAWSAASWSEPFVDIEGGRRPAPRLGTRMRIVWDESCLYIGATLAEPHVWATIDRRDAVIYHENDFEVFLDPDGDARDYVELEINARNTVWDLFLPLPYRDGGRDDTGWDIAGLRTAVAVQGTLNDPTDTDSGWTVEIAIPWDGLRRARPTAVAPRSGERWRINFSRVEWRTTVADGVYRRLAGVPEDNWTWSPQGMIDMHQPERWGYLEFADSGPAPGAAPDTVRR